MSVSFCTPSNLVDIRRTSLKETYHLNPDTANIPIIFTTNTLSLEADDGSQVFEVDGEKYRAFAKPLHYRKLLSTIRKEINRKIHGGMLPPEK